MPRQTAVRKRGQMRNDLAHGDIVQPDKVDELMDFLAPVIADLLSQLEPGEFTTPAFIDLLRSTPEGGAAYDEALRRWGERDQLMSKMVIHGQVIPGVLRRMPSVEWAGFAHEATDEYAIAAWWRLRDAGPSGEIV
jgi:hypothetical protein